MSVLPRLVGWGLAVLLAAPPAVADATAGPPRVFPAAGSFTSIGALQIYRVQHTATLLTSGKVLIAGSYTWWPYEVNPRPAELYDPATGTFYLTGSMRRRYSHTATLLLNGKVLVVGGVSVETLYEADLYDPATGTFTTTGTLNTSRAGHTATLLPDGKVLIAGGYNTREGEGDAFPAGAELYDPATGLFTPAGSLSEPRASHTATVLPDGKILLAGGRWSPPTSPDVWPLTAELYDPETATFTPTGALGKRRQNHTATLMSNGKVLVVGGSGDDPTSAELYDPAVGTFSATPPMTCRRNRHTATLLPDGRVLLVGTSGPPSDPHIAEIYDPAQGAFTTDAALYPRYDHSATMLQDGRVLIAGGGGDNLCYLYTYPVSFEESRRPAITSAPASLEIPAGLTIEGSGFRGGTEAASGGTNSSPTNLPLVRLQRVDVAGPAVLIAPTAPLSGNSWSGTLSDLPSGTYELSVVTNAIPSLPHTIEISTPPRITAVLPRRGLSTGGQVVTVTGTSLANVTVTIGENEAQILSTSATSVLCSAPAHAPGTVDVTVTSTEGEGSATAAGAFTYLASAPANVVATAAGADSVIVTWTAAPDAAAYEILRSSDGTTFTLLGGTTDTSYTDSSPSSDTAYLYAVRVSAPSASHYSMPDVAHTFTFTDPALVPGTTVVNALHIAELRTVVTALASLAGMTNPVFATDPTITPGVTRVRAAHTVQLRTALDAARAALQLPAHLYLRAPPVANGRMYADDVAGIRTGTQ